jgi:hypothetical protein
VNRNVENTVAPDADCQRRFWAFISYSHEDELWARWLAKKLEAFTIPPAFRKPTSANYSRDRLRPVFRDTEELPASANLGARLEQSLLASEFLIVICSRASATSKWVDAEVRFFIEHRGADRILLLVVDGTPRCPGDEPKYEALPTAILELPHEPIWVDVRQESRRRALLRIAAGMLGVGFDQLWRRASRRRNLSIASWSSAAAVVAMVSLAMLWRAREQAERLRPETQIIAFEKFMDFWIRRKIAPDEFSSQHRQIVAMDDLNGDGFLDFVVAVTGTRFCGSGGCSRFVFTANGDATYRQVLDLFSHGNIRIVPTSKTNGYRDLMAMMLVIERGPAIWSVFRWDGQAYLRSHFSACSAIAELCEEEATLIDEIPESHRRQYRIRQDAVTYSQPEKTRQTLGNAKDVSVLGKVRTKDWYLVYWWKNNAGFIAANDVTPPPAQ